MKNVIFKSKKSRRHNEKHISLCAYFGHSDPSIEPQRSRRTSSNSPGVESALVVGSIVRQMTQAIAQYRANVGVFWLGLNVGLAQVAPGCGLLTKLVTGVAPPDPQQPIGNQM